MKVAFPFILLLSLISYVGSQAKKKQIFLTFCGASAARSDPVPRVQLIWSLLAFSSAAAEVGGGARCQPDASRSVFLPQLDNMFNRERLQEKDAAAAAAFLIFLLGARRFSRSLDRQQQPVRT